MKTWIVSVYGLLTLGAFWADIFVSNAFTLIGKWLLVLIGVCLLLWQKKRTNKGSG
jgi:hypothetical protein